MCIDSTSNKSSFECAFCHYVRVLVDSDMIKKTQVQNPGGKDRIFFFVEIEYEKLHEFYSYSDCIRHSMQN